MVKKRVMKRFWVEVFWITLAGNGIRTMFTYMAYQKDAAIEFAREDLKNGHFKMYGEEIDPSDIRRINCGEMKSGYFNERKWNNPR